MRLFLCLIVSSLWVIIGNAQKNMTFPLHSNEILIQRSSPILNQECSGKLNPHLNKENWNIQMTHLGAIKHATTVPHKEMLVLKEKANNVKVNGRNIELAGNLRYNFSMDTAALSHNFRGNARGASVPMDNTVAVSHNGHIVSAINSNVIFTQPDGVISYNKGFTDFFTLLGLGTRMYDPRVIYDTEDRRFIFMCLHGSDPNSTFLCLAFSETEDPNGAWNYYAVRGNPDGDDNWFDYPNISVSHHDYYITGLMRDRNGDWQYSVMYQIDKESGYNGETLQFRYYNDINDADGALSFNLVPTPSGSQELLTPGMYFVSNNPQGGNTYNLHYTTDSALGNPSLIAVQTIGLETALAPDARQPNFSKRLNTFDSRIWSAMYHNGTIHMGSHVNTTDGDVGLFYGRMNVVDASVKADVLHIPNVDFGFPSFAHFGKNYDDNDILVNYIVSGVEKFASQEVRICRGAADEFIWSEPTVVREGRSVIDVLDGDVDRWGDYTTAGRRFVNDRVEAWITGCFGETRSYGTWLGQLHHPETEDNDIYVDFVANRTTLPKDTEVTFKNISKVTDGTKKWIFEGGNPSESSDESPTVTYLEDGVYSVTLIVEVDGIVDTLTKDNYIFIQDDEVPPMAAFEQAKDTIYVGDSVQFFNQSSLNTKVLRWTFVNGTPRSSTEENPIIVYNRTGSFPVALTALNIAGLDGFTKQRAVTVIPRVAPSATFDSDKTQISKDEVIQYFDRSKGGIVERNWYFDGGTPQVSQDENPLVEYKEDGVYDVKLVVSNELGKDSIIIENYIQVGVSSTKSWADEMNLKLFPNPVQDDRVAVEFFMPESKRINFVLYNSLGQPIKILYKDRIKQGNNILRFGVGHLNAGLFILKVEDNDQVIKSMSFVKL